MESLTSDSDSHRHHFDAIESPSSLTTPASDDDATYATVSTAPPKRRAGRTKFRETRHPLYKGVRRRNPDKWVCEVREPNKKSRIWLGTFPTAEMAARAHDVAAMALRGRSACLNFADSAWLLPVLKSDNAKEIKKAAAKAAEAFRPSASDGSRDRTAEMDVTPESSCRFIEEEEFGIHGYLANMTMMSPQQSPPQPQLSGGGGGYCGHYLDDVEENGADVSLWSYSM